MTGKQYHINAPSSHIRNKVGQKPVKGKDRKRQKVDKEVTQNLPTHGCPPPCTTRQADKRRLLKLPISVPTETNTKSKIKKAVLKNQYILLKRHNNNSN